MTPPFKKEEKKETSLKTAPMPPLPFEKDLIQAKGTELSKQAERIAHQEGGLTLEEATVLVKDLKEKEASLRQQLDALFEMRGLSPLSLQRYLSDPAHFTPEQWQLMKEKREEVLASLRLLSGETSASSSPSSAPRKAAPAEVPSKAEKKFKGQRRGWIFMK